MSDLRPTRKCSDCKAVKPFTDYVRGVRSDLKKCARCRARTQKNRNKRKFPAELCDQTSVTAASEHQNCQSGKESPAAAVWFLPERSTLDECFPQIRLFIDDAKASEAGYHIMGVVTSQNLVGVDGLRIKCEETKLELERIDGHDYSCLGKQPRCFTSGKAIFHFHCSQSSKKLRRKSRENQKRQSRPVQSFDCDGEITVVLFENGRLEFSLKHALVHEVRPHYEVTEDVKKFIEENRDLPSAALVTYQLRLQHRKGNFPEMSHIKPAQIYYHYAQIQTDRFKRHDDALISARMLLQEQDDTKIICSSTTAYECLGILTPIFHSVMACPGRESEISFDGTHGTNSQGHELFACIACVDGEGFPVSYFTVSKVAGDGDKIQALKQWYVQLKTHGVDPEFISLDKDSAEIAAVRFVWPSAKIKLCWWHVKKAANKRFRSNKSPNYGSFDYKSFQRDCADFDVTCPFVSPPSQSTVFGFTGQITISKKVFCPDEWRSTAEHLMSLHLHRHMLIPDFAGVFRSAHEIRSTAFSEIVLFCVSNNLPDLLVYMYNQWYCGQMWSLWTRSSHETVPRMRTNMVCESHFNYVKHTLLHNSHRPRLDFLFYVLTNRGMIDFSLKLTLRQNGRSLPRWLNDFKKEWKDKKGQKLSGAVYRTDPSQWTCSCLGFLLSRFLLCKHLINLAPEVPDLSLVKRSTSHPFVSFPRIEGNRIALFMDPDTDATGLSNSGKAGLVGPSEMGKVEQQVAAGELKEQLRAIRDELDKQIVFAQTNPRQLEVLRSTLKTFKCYSDAVSTYHRRRTTAKTWKCLQKNKYLRNLL